MNHSGQSFSALLEAYCAAAFRNKENAQVKGLTDISAGWESTLYSFWLEHGPAAERQTERMVLRLLVGEGADDKARREFQAMRRLYQVGYPVPDVYTLECESSPFGQPFILMEHIDGEQLWPLISNATGQEREQFLTLFCQLFTQLHALDWRPFTSEQAFTNPYHFIDRSLALGRDYLRRFPQNQALEPVFKWLEVHREGMGCPRPSPVHQDFHPANVLVRPDGSAVVIDWTGFAVSDSRFDLAWTLILAYAYEGTAMRDQVLHTYERVSGKKVEQLAGFEVIACLRRLLDVSISLLAGPEQLGMRPEAAAAMQAQLPAHKRVAKLLAERTGSRSAPFESLWS